MGDLPIKKQQNQLNKIIAQEKKNNFRGIFNLNETLKSFSWTRPKSRGISRVSSAPQGSNQNNGIPFQWLLLLLSGSNHYNGQMYTLV